MNRRWFSAACGVCLILASPLGMAERVNFAKYQKVTASSSNGTYRADFAVDGLVSNFNSFRTGTNGPHWLAFEYSRPIELASAHLYLGLDNIYRSQQVLANFKLQSFQEGEWVDIPGSGVSGNTATEVNLIFNSPVTSDRFRLYSSNTGNRIIREVALFPPNLVEGVEQGFPIGTDVRLNLAYQRPMSSSSALLNNSFGPGYAKNAFDGYRDNSSRWLCNPVEGEFLEVDLLIDQVLGSAHLHSGFIDETAEVRDPVEPIPDFTIEYWTGSAWVPIPGATITGNAESSREIVFSENVTTSRVRLVSNSASNARVQEFLLFPPRPGGYELGREAVDAAPPTAKWDDYSDRSYLLRSIVSVDRRLAVRNDEVVFTGGGNGGRVAQGWQLLLNHRDGSYRVRHVASGECLALAMLPSAEQSRVVVEPYSGLPHQDWFLEQMDATHFRLLNAYSGQALQSRFGDWTANNPAAVGAPSSNPTQLWRFVVPLHHPKRGISGTGNPTAWGNGLSSIEDSYYTFKATDSWSYTWGRSTSDVHPYMEFSHTFNPMQWGNFNWLHSGNQGPPDRNMRDLQSNPKPVHFMGFNEPDKTDQGLISVAEAIRRWPRLEALGAPLVSPAPANAFNGWMADFVTQADALGLRRDYTAVHWYGAPNVDSLVSHLQQNFNRFGRPIWLTEFSTVDWNQNSSWTHSDNYEFLASFLWRAESLSWLRRYAIFQFREGPTDNPNQGAPSPPGAPRSDSRKFDGSLTPFGELYAVWDGVTATPSAGRAYHLHNSGKYSRLQNDSGSNAATTEPGVSGVATQWFLEPGLTSNTVRIVSSRDGRPLRFIAGGTVGFAPAGTESTSVEWRLAPDSDGRFFIEHPLTNQRLRNNGPESFSMVPITNTGINLKWRFINVLEPEPIVVPTAPLGLAAEVTEGAITLSWSPSEDALSYLVQRSETASGPWQTLATGLSEVIWSDLNPPAGATLYYQILASNALGLSEPSDVVFVTTKHPFATYQGWVATALADQSSANLALSADPDRDNLANLLEFAFLSDPLTATGSPFEIIAVDAATITIEFPWNWRAEDYRWDLRVSETLAAPVASWPLATPQSSHPVRQGDHDIYTVTLARPVGTQAFFVLEVVAN